MTASITAALLAAAALTGLGVASASASTLDSTAVAANSQAELTVTVHTRPFGGAFTVSGSLAPVVASEDCVSDAAYLGWKADSTSGGFNTTNAGDVKVFSADVAELPTSGSVTVTAQGGCTGPDGLYPNLELTIAVNLADMVDYAFNSIVGVANVGDHPAPSDTSYQPAAGVVVDLMDASLGATGAPVASDTTGSDGVYWLPAPVGTQAEADRSYKLRFTYADADSTVVYYDGGTPSAWESSTSDWASATDVGGPTGWAFGNDGFDAMLSTASAPASTNVTRLCNAADSQQIDGFDTASVSWEGICETDPTFWNAETPSGMTAAFSRFGTVWIDQAAGAYTVTADSFTTDDAGGVLTTTLHDDDIYLLDQDVTVDVTITRAFQGSDTRWVIEVRDATTGDLVDVPFTFGGGFQNGNDRTKWTNVAGMTTWISDSGAQYASDVREAIIAHRVDADAFSVHTGFESIQVDVTAGGRLSYYLSVLDYTGCVVGAARTSAAAVADSLPSTFGQDRAPLVGDACVVSWPAPDLDLTVGVPFDETFLVATTRFGFSGPGGGAVWLEDDTELPAGLTFQAVDDYVDGVTPSYRIFGTPTTAGPFDVTVLTMNSVYRSDSTHLVGTVQAPVQMVSITLNFGIGDEVAGATADVDGTGLQPGSDYEVIVESTPQTVGSGTIDADYLLDDTVAMPAGLEEGWHTISLAGTFHDGTPAAMTVWFRIAADGTLAEVSPTAPAGDPNGPPAPGPGTDLASTGADAGGGFTVALLLLLGGAAAVLLRRRRATAR